MANNNLVIGILAHVDAGKTTLSEAILYQTGAIRKLGRVDHKNAFLDGNPIEQNRGITVFSKEARFAVGKNKAVLLDTPGHADFSSEMERTLQVLDYAILVISGADGVQSHTITLWKLLETYNIPTFVFANKMDQSETDPIELIEEIKRQLGGGFCCFENGQPKDYEELVMCDEDLMEEYLSTGNIEQSKIVEAIQDRKVFPVCFGSALKMVGIDGFLKTIETHSKAPNYGLDFGARVYKITRDKQGIRQTHMKITGGVLKNKMVIDTNNQEEKVDQLRLLSGKNFEAVSEVEAGNICVATGLSKTYAGQTLGAESQTAEPMLEATIVYRINLPEGTSPSQAMEKFNQLREENPSQNITWNEQLQEIQVRVMGKLELEILQHVIKERFDLEVSFDEGSVIYKETISKPVIGIGHFEPLRHYAEVHLLMEPLPGGSGLVFDTAVSEEQLSINWQKLVISHLKEREHPGILTGSAISDMKITLIGGRGHLKHTEGGDFRQATYRALRQGLKKADNILLEPMLSFKLEVPNESVGRGLSDMHRFGCQCSPPQIDSKGATIITGKGPMIFLQDYQQEVASYTKGNGKFNGYFAGYGPCHNQEEIAASFNYDADGDVENPTGSIFCHGGSGEYVSWDKVDATAHVDSGYKTDDEKLEEKSVERESQLSYGEKELEEIFRKTYGNSKRDEELRRQRVSQNSFRPAKPQESPLIKNLKENQNSEALLVIDGYNVIFAWDELKALAEINLDSARETFVDILENYTAYKGIKAMVVFDGYKVSGNVGSRFQHGNLEEIFTKEAQTADRFIEETVYEMVKKHTVRVVTSDKPVQMAALGDGALRTSAREFYTEVIGTSQEIKEKLQKQRVTKNRPFERLKE